MTNQFRSPWRLRPLLAAAVALLLSGAGLAAQTVPTGGAALVRAGDQVALKIWNEPEMSDTFNISASGAVVLPKLGSMRVTELSVDALQDSLRRAYAVYLRNPSVEVTVLRRVGVEGEVRNPDLYMVDLTMTLRELIARAGGITPTGDPDKVFVIRDGERLRFGGAGRTRFTTADLLSGDQVVVGQRSWFERNALAVASTAAVVVGVLAPILSKVFEDEQGGG